MIGENIDQTKLNETAASELLLEFPSLLNSKRIVIAIAGESGSGKTHMAVALEHTLNHFGKRSFILHMDDFFILPPALNHQKRVENISHVGPQEVDLNRLNAIIDSFKAGADVLHVPQVHYYDNRIEELEIAVGDIDILLVEGTYSFYLALLDFKLYMSRTFKETRELRALRNRGNEINDPFVEEVLALEHELICQKKSEADAMIDYHFNLKINE